MASIGEVTDRLREVLTSCGAAADHLRDADELLQAASEALALALTGANDDESIRALRLGLATVGEAVTPSTPPRTVSGGRSVGSTTPARSGSGATGGATEKPASPKQPRAAPAGRPAAEQIRRLRDELPPDVLPPERRERGAPRPKTHGRWIGPDGQVHQIVSGEDQDYAESVKAFQDLGAPGLPTRACDVEMKLAAHMRDNGVTSADVVINNVPCPGQFGCDGLLPVLLPSGSTLTVHGSNDFTKTYQGGAKPPWRR